MILNESRMPSAMGSIKRCIQIVLLIFLHRLLPFIAADSRIRLRFQTLWPAKREQHKELSFLGVRRRAWSIQAQSYARAIPTVALIARSTD